MGNRDINGCDCCIGDEAIYWKDNENNAFIDSKGEMMVKARDKLIWFNVKFCPSYGRKFEFLISSSMAYGSRRGVIWVAIKNF